MQANRSIPVIDSAQSDRQQFLKLAIQPGLMAIVEIECVMELMNISIDRVVPMPHLPPAVRGVYNWRGEILWIVDLAMLLDVRGEGGYRKIQPTIVFSSASHNEIGSSTQGSQPRQTPATTATDLPPQKTIGFIVDEIVEIQLCQLDLGSGSFPAQFNPGLAQLVRGVWESPTGEDCLVLDGPAILDRADVHADARWHSLSLGESDLNHFFR